jgi:hypothetical protein
LGEGEVLQKSGLESWAISGAMSTPHAWSCSIFGIAGKGDLEAILQAD